MRLFFYGTMRDPDVRRMVFGDRAAELTLRSALLHGFRPCSARDGDYPVLVRSTAARAQWPDAGNLEQPTTGIILPGHVRQLGIELSYPSIQFARLRPYVLDQVADARC